MKPNNPFLISGYHSPEYFCDRIVESRTIADALYNGRNITLIAPRRMGKTGLIKNVFYNLKEQNPDIVTIYMDIYSTQNLNNFVLLMASSVLGKLDSTAQTVMSRVTKFIRSCRPVFTIDEITGTPSVKLDTAMDCGESTLKEIFEYLASADKRCYIAIDEFQQINEYPENGIEALLRSYIQFTPNVNFIFSGSKQHVMQDMFLSAKRPFYQSTQTLPIDVINSELYYKFTEKFFKDKNLEFNRDAFDYIYNRFSGYTWYILSLLNRMYSYNSDIKIETADMAINEIVKESIYAYETLISAYTANNIALLKAISKEGIIAEITSSNFITKHKLKAASSVRTSLTKLINKELVYETSEGYIIYDRFMNIWLSQQSF
ncbi:MAG: ATP-binding protein [Bacteroidales bacterium]